MLGKRRQQRRLEIKEAALFITYTLTHTHSLQINTHSTPKGDKEELELSYESELRDKFERIKILNNAQHIPHKPHLCETNKSEYKRVSVGVCVEDIPHGI